MRGFAIDVFEKPDKMKLGEESFICNVVKDYVLMKIPVNEKLRMYNAIVKVEFRICFFWVQCYF